MRAKSAQIKHSINEMEAIEEQLSHQIKKSTLLDGDRKQFWKQAEDVKEKNKDTIDKLKLQNKRLKQLRDELSGNKKLGRSLGSNSFSNFTNEIRDQNFWRRQLDKERHMSISKKKSLLHLQDMLREVEDSKTGYIQESPLMKNIRVLENRLDKVMIKYNEAQSIKKTYEQIVKRLKEQRVGYDNQLAAIQRSLKGKEHDFEELLLLAHDATHTKQLAYTEFKKYDAKRGSVQELRNKYLEEKRTDIDRKKQTMAATSNTDKESKIEIKQRPQAIQEMFNDRDKSNYQKEDLNKYEQAFRKLKEVTGVLDSNEIIQKYKTQELTANSLTDLKKEYQVKVLNLKQTKNQLKQQLSNKLSKNDRNCDRQHMNKLQNKTNETESKLQVIRLKHERTHKLLINARSGLEHLSRHLEFFKVQQINHKQSFPELTLDQINKKLSQLYGIVQNDSEYSAEFFKQSVVNIEQILRNKDMNEQAVLLKNNRVRNCMEDDDDTSENDLNQDVGLESGTKQEVKNVRVQNARRTFSKRK